jgi:hypothetical protein
VLFNVVWYILCWYRQLFIPCHEYTFVYIGLDKEALWYLAATRSPRRRSFNL